jgi:mannose-6-phosphate isomerase-like protein (cupin superfamily)
VWHANEGPEAFVLLSGTVDMHYREDGEERVARLAPTDIFLIRSGEEHRAVPVGEARILVIEHKGTV